MSVPWRELDSHARRILYEQPIPRSRLRPFWSALGHALLWALYLAAFLSLFIEWWGV